MSDELMSAMRRYGAAMADATANDPPGQQACYGTVNSVSGATMAVSVKGAEAPVHHLMLGSQGRRPMHHPGNRPARHRDRRAS